MQHAAGMGREQARSLALGTEVEQRTQMAKCRADLPFIWCAAAPGVRQVLCARSRHSGRLYCYD